MKRSITKYNNAVVARLKDRRIAIMDVPDKNCIYVELTNIIVGRKWKPVRTSRVKGRKVVTSILLSYEGMNALFECYYHLKNNIKSTDK